MNSLQSTTSDLGYFWLLTIAYLLDYERFLNMKRWLTAFYAHLMRQWSWWLLIPTALAIKAIAYFPEGVERYYSNGLFPKIALVQRFLFGWIPFSVGDLIYALLLLALIYQLGQLFWGLIKRRLSRARLAELIQRILFLLLLAYVGFNLLWGLNYSRPSLASNLKMEVRTPTMDELDTLATDLLQRLDQYANQVSPQQRDSFNRKKLLFSGAQEAYRHAFQAPINPVYRVASLKPSLFSYPGNYLGFQGYYNPFTGEAQVNTTIPRFLEPFVATHEIAHQLGYAKEQEANFVAVLACDRSAEPAFRYSMYLDVFLYTLGEIALRDTARASYYRSLAHNQVKADMMELRTFVRKHRNPLERVVRWMYGEFLRANNQPNGHYTYSEVVPWVIAYRRAYGRNSLL